MTLQNPFTDTHDNYRIVCKTEKIKVRGVEVEFKARYLQDSNGELSKKEYDYLEKEDQKDENK